MAGPHSILSAVMGVPRGVQWSIWHKGRRGVSLDAPSENRERDRGTRVHRVVPDLLRGVQTPIEAFEVFDRNHVEALYEWHEERRPELIFAELHVVSERLEINGYIDYVRRCPGCPNCLPGAIHRNGKIDPIRMERTLSENPSARGVILGDQKHGGLLSPHAHVQVGGAYRLMWEEDPNHPEPVCGAELLGILVDGFPKPYCVVPAVGTPAMFEHGLTWYRDLEDLGGSMTVEDLVRDDGELPWLWKRNEQERKIA